jgi:hypothetical protein
MISFHLSQFKGVVPISYYRVDEKMHLFSWCPFQQKSRWKEVSIAANARMFHDPILAGEASFATGLES